MPADRGVGAVKHRPGGKQGLGGEEALFDRQQVAVAQHHRQGRHRQAGAQDEHAIELRIRLDLRRVDGKSVVSGSGQEAAVALFADQTLGPARQLALQAVEQLGAGFGVLARLFLVAADDIAAAMDLDLFHRQIGFDPSGRGMLSGTAVPSSCRTVSRTSVLDRRAPGRM